MSWVTPVGLEHTHTLCGAHSIRKADPRDTPCAGCLTASESTTTSGCEAGYVRPTNISVLLITDVPSSYAEIVRLQLFNSSAFTRVDLLQLDTGSNTGVPTLQYLQGYQAVFLFLNNYVAGLANRTVEYWYTGGAVVASAPAICNNLGERFNSEGFALLGSIQCDAWESSSFSSGNVSNAASPLMANVSSLSQLQCYTVSGSVINGGVVVASWDSGKPLVVRGSKNGRSLVTLYLYPLSSDYAWYSLGPASSLSALLRNAVVYSTCVTRCSSACTARAACAPGSYIAPGSSSSSTCTTCMPGSYSPGTGMTACILCTPGTFQTGVGMSACKACPTGTNSSAVGAKTSSVCVKGNNLAPEALTLPPTQPGTGPCELSDLTWIRIVSVLGRAAWTGGLGELINNEVQAWVCILHQFAHPACPSPPDLACFVFNERSGLFAYWGPNSQLKLHTKGS